MRNFRLLDGRTTKRLQTKPPATTVFANHVGRVVFGFTSTVEDCRYTITTQECVITSATMLEAIITGIKLLLYNSVLGICSVVYESGENDEQSDTGT